MQKSENVSTLLNLVTLIIASITDEMSRFLKLFVFLLFKTAYKNKNNLKLK